ncbi:MAG: CDP-glucose 4,6-dehydratase [Rhizomicrobium sp.]|jgi:CDP-glucose 4,6-dehydratase
MGGRRATMEDVAMTSRTPDPSFWNGKRVLVTGHTGFKGSWVSLWLARLGAQITGLALAPETSPNLFELADVRAGIESRMVDLRDFDAVNQVVRAEEPEIVLHLGAQSLVRRGYASPLETFAVNTLGTANLLEALRTQAAPAAVLIVTTDKVYENDEDGHAFAETDPLGGHDPYSASKAAVEIVTRSYARSYFRDARIATARGGNVIGGGDFSDDRLVPDVWRAAQANEPVTLRYPDATRPWQHVLDCLNGYLVYLEDLAQAKPLPHALNFAPDDSDTLSVRTMVERLQRGLDVSHGWARETGDFPKEMRLLKLSAEQASAALGWRNRLDADRTIAWTVDWYRAFTAGRNVRDTTVSQIAAFSEDL